MKATAHAALFSDASKYTYLRMKIHQLKKKAPWTIAGRWLGMSIKTKIYKRASVGWLASRLIWKGETGDSFSLARAGAHVMIELHSMKSLSSSWTLAQPRPQNDS